MLNLTLYSLTVLIWGTTWIAIKFQLGEVAIEASMLYRFALAALLMVAGLTLLRRWRPLGGRDHLFCLLQGACLFCFNFYCFYNATQYISSGLASVVFSLATVANAVNGWWIYGNRPSGRVIAGASLGVCGVAAMFWPDLSGSSFSRETLWGLGLAVLGTTLFSFGNMISIRQRQRGLPLPLTNAWGLMYGVLILLLLGWGKGVEYSLEWSERYLGSLLYLALAGTVVAFTTYLMLVARIGPDKAAYTTVMFPAVALTVSTFYEGYVWTLPAIYGFGLVLCGNLLIFARLPKRWPGWPGLSRSGS